MTAITQNPDLSVLGVFSPRYVIVTLRIQALYFPPSFATAVATTLTKRAGRHYTSEITYTSACLPSCHKTFVMIFPAVQRLDDVWAAWAWQRHGVK